MSFTDTKIQEIQTDIEVLKSGYKALKQQSRNAIDTLERQRLDRKANDIEVEALVKEEELKELKASQGQNSHNRNYLNLEQELSKFDFTEAVKIFEDIIDKFPPNGGGALFLLQNSFSMGGERCCVRLRELLRSRTREGNFKHYPTKLSYSEPNEVGLLRRLAGYLNVKSQPEYREQCAQEIIRKIHNSVPESGHIIFIEVTEYDYLFEQEHILPWFLENFWVPLVQELSNTAKNYRRVQFVGLIVADSTIPSKCLPTSICCTTQEFSYEKIIELPLKKCTYDEIEKWLDLLSGRPTDEVNRMTKVIYDASEKGKPDLVYRKLIQSLS
ncbi:MAG: hypothetical protein DSM106950_18105 [Stigonema ocellatum SAG 48.90 = DSM 106950]|nr:hypothetical protein [Stigonema ocellatum SAG 48.90 = DSM 106950]